MQIAKAFAEREPKSEVEVESKPELHIGDMVADKNRPDDVRLIVVGLSDLQANEKRYNGINTVADANPGYPEDDAVVLCIYSDALDNPTVDPEKDSYAFPRSRLELVESVQGDR